MRNVKKILKKYKVELIIFFLALVFSTWLMYSTFSAQKGEIQIASKAWSDFASHIPLIRSFSFGDNFPPQYPLFSGPPIKYHFIFYALVGLLEKIGIPLGYALNIPSIFGFSFLILMIYLFSKEIFKSTFVGILSILFFIFNGSLDFVNFFKKNPISLNTFTDILQNKNFISFGPYDGKIISAFWNLNVYTNQRHLGLSFALSLFIIYLFLKFKEGEKSINFKKSLIIGVVFGCLFILNMAVFLMTLLILCLLFILLGKNRVYILISILLGGLIALPQYLFTQSLGSSFKLTLTPGYLVTNLNLANFFIYWLQNLGLHIFLIPLGFIIANKTSKKIFVVFLSLFFVGNLIQFAPEIAANHKFFNYFMITGSMFSAYFLYFLWKKHLLLKPLVVILTFILILSGIINLFPILNDNKISLSDYPNNKNVSWIMKNTNPKSVFLNTQYLYDPASVAGRKIFLGWPYFAWSQGYDTLTRDNIRKSLLSTNDLSFFCTSALRYNIDYIEISSSSNDIVVNREFFEKNFIKLYKNTQDGFSIYEVKTGCT